MSTVLVYSDDPAVRERVMLAVGRRPDPDLDRINWVEVDDAIPLESAVRRGVDGNAVDLVILDGEAAPTGGMGISRELKSEVADCPPTLVLIARRDDRWLARWSLADGVAQQPPDPIELTNLVVTLLRQRKQRLPVKTAAALRRR